MSLWQKLVDALFPHICCSCGATGSPLCKNCYGLLLFTQQQPIPKPPLTSITSALQYRFPTSNLIKRLKFGGIIDISKTCAEIIYVTTQLPVVDIITAVPLHPSRLRQRGYNQAAEIAQHLATLSHVPYQELLIRSKATQAQTSTKSRLDRQKNLEQAFIVLTADTNLTNKQIIIVDDVYTTGATLQACAQALAKLNPAEIHALTLAIKQ